MVLALILVLSTTIVYSINPYLETSKPELKNGDRILYNIYVSFYQYPQAIGNETIYLNGWIQGYLDVRIVSHNETGFYIIRNYTKVCCFFTDPQATKLISSMINIPLKDFFYWNSKPLAKNESLLFDPHARIPYYVNPSYLVENKTLKQVIAIPGLYLLQEGGSEYIPFYLEYRYMVYNSYGLLTYFELDSRKYDEQWSIYMKYYIVIEAIKQEVHGEKTLLSSTNFYILLSTIIAIVLTISITRSLVR